MDLEADSIYNILGSINTNSFLIQANDPYLSVLVLRYSS